MRVYEFLNSAGSRSAHRGGAADRARRRAGHLLSPGDFLTGTTTWSSKNAGPSCSIHRPWHADWGGHLQFLDADGHLAEGYTPAFNALNLLRVPQPHSVSYVTPLASGARYSITGWLRER
jgi:hypothetical protein